MNGHHINWRQSYSSERRAVRESSGWVTFLVLVPTYLVVLYTFAGWLIPEVGR